MRPPSHHRMHRAAAVVLAALVAVPLAVTTSASADEPSPATVSIDLEGTWKFTVGDHPAYSDTSFDDSTWDDIEVPGDGTPFADYDGFGWYRLDFTLPADAAGTNLVASMGFLDDVDEAFLNGVRIGGSGTRPPAARSQGFEKRLYPVPAGAPNFGGENTLAVRLYDMSGGGGWYEGPVGIFSKDAVRENVYGITGAMASSEQSAAINAVLANQKAALAAGDVEAYLDTLDPTYFHDGRSQDRRARELQTWVDESGTLDLIDGEVEVVRDEDGSLIVDTNRSIIGTRDGEDYAFQPSAQQFLRFSGTPLLETGNNSRFFRETVDSQLEGEPREFVTYLPPSYLTDPDREYPVVYLLHGINGGSREWEPRDMDEVFDGLWDQDLAESIVIMPDGESLWYADQPDGTPWRSMFLTEMVPLVDDEYRTLASREFRGLTGISMGGFGAYSIGLSNPEMFSSLASHIGSLGYTPVDLPTPVEQAASMTTEELKAFEFYYDACEEDDFRFDNAVRAMDETLTAKGVEYTSAVYPEGRHNDACWMPHVPDSFTVHSDNFRASGLVEEAPEPTPTPTIEPTPAPTPTPTVKPTFRPQDVYTTPGYHTIDGRRWFTKCEPYSTTSRCWTSIWSTQVMSVDGRFVSETGWFHNNLTYVASKRSAWTQNPLGYTTKWTTADGRQWYTECDTARTGGNGCRSYIRVNNLVEASPRTGGGYTYSLVNTWVFNNIMMFT
ncbi:MAG: alpha/beta hydrolase-fold protein [Arachnia sp.]